MSERPPTTLADDGPSDWTNEPPSDVLLAVGLLRLLAGRLNEREGER